MMRIHSISRLLACATLAGLALFATTASAQDFKAPLARLDLSAGDTVVFLGDSITHQCLYTQYVEDYYYTRFPGLKIKFHNAGVGGARARDALDRFDRDVAAYKPKYVTVLLGMNDGSYQPYDDKTFQTYRADMTELVARIREIGAVPILMTPTMYDSRAARLRDPKAPAGRVELYNSTLAYYGTWLREIAVESGAGFVDMYSPLNNLTLAARKTDPNFTLIKDAVHPDPPGQLVMAFALLRDLDSPGVVGDIHIAIDAGGTLAAQATGGELADLKAADGAVEFTWKAAALPFVVPAEAASAARMLYLGHVLGRELLAVSGLPSGGYELKIDGDPVGIYSAAGLAQGIGLEDNPRTPQYKQALQIAELNKRRNAGPVRNLRNEWSQMQQFYRLQRQAKADPNNPDAAKNLEAQTKKVEGLEERVAKHEQEAGEIEREILASNRPAPHKYRFAPIPTGSCTGRLILNGKPLAGATVLFDGEAGRAASGKSDKDGNFIVRISDLAPFVAAGQYRVAIQGGSVPAKYSDLNVTSLRVEVGSGPNTFNFELID
jgi:lysophospholipase L1-like esterase